MCATLYRFCLPRRFRCPVFVAVIGVVVALATMSRVALATSVIVTKQGPLSGFPYLEETVYFGIPYAAPPVGSLRWLPPQPPAHFKGVFQATQTGNVCVQSDGVGGTMGDEDCLTLNVVVPDVSPPRGGFPVMVWIHGGGLVEGAGFFYDPTPIVQNGNVIVVTINYRLGLLGFFAHPAIDAEHHPNANYGLMDQQFALKWVRDNIEAFGGNNRRVTIFGESAGGFSVLSNVASPTAAGLFDGAISESGAYAHFQQYYDTGADASVVSLKTAEKSGTLFVPAGTTFSAGVGCGSDASAKTAKCLRAVPASSLVLEEPGIVFPIIDGTVLTQRLSSSFAGGNFNKVPIINGTNHDEWRNQVATEYGDTLMDADYPAAVAAFINPPNPSLVNQLVELYPLSDYPPPAGYSVSAPLALGALGTDVFFVCTARQADLSLSRYTPTYTYEFHDETAPSFFGTLNFPPGDYHFVEVLYLFDFGLLSTPEQQQLSNTMIGYWTQFARTGNPNSDGAPYWPAYRSKHGQLESLVAPTPTTITDSSFDADHKCSSFWDQLVIP